MDHSWNRRGRTAGNRAVSWRFTVYHRWRSHFGAYLGDKLSPLSETTVLTANSQS